MRLRDLTRAADGSPLLLQVDAAPLLHGALRTAEERDGWVRPWRFSADQLRALGSCQAWHPGLFRQMARTTAGVSLEFETDSSEIALEVVLDPEPAGTRAVLDGVDTDGTVRPHDGVSVDVDGRHLFARLPDEGDDYLPFSLDDSDRAPEDGLMRLPGMGETHHVRVWLPCLRGCVVRDVVGNGSFITPVERTGGLLVLGDSIAQGFVADDPALTWASLLSQRLGLDLVNQGIGGQVFQPGTTYGIAQSLHPQAIVVCLGANYRYEPCRARPVTRDVRAYLLEVSRIWPEVPTYALTPLWHDELAHPSHAMSCYRQLPSFIAAHVAPHDQMELVDGGRLLDARSSLMADGFEHPGPDGHRQVADRLGAIVSMGRMSEGERRATALEALTGAPRRTLPLSEALRRGLGVVVFAQRGCVLLRLDDGVQMFWAGDHDLGRAVIAALMEPTVVDVLEPALVRDIELTHALTRLTPYHSCLYERRTPVEVDGQREMRPLDESHFLTVCANYRHPEYRREDEVLALLRAGRILGGFEGGRLVGFVGERPEGSIGMLEVLPGQWRKGWAYALEATKINEALARGDVPWAEVEPDDSASIRLQRKLGMRVLAANEQCFLSRPADGLGPGQSAPDAGPLVHE